MPGLRRMPTKRTPWKLWVGMLCCGLILFAGMLSVAHTHADGDVNHPDCGLCVTAHMSVQAAAVLAQPAVAELFTRVAMRRPVDRPRTPRVFALLIRPPPVDGSR